MSVLIAATCFVLGSIGMVLSLPVQVTGIVWYLGLINAILVIFNLVPAFPLDGGRVLRSILWRWRGDLTWATKITASLGGSFGMFLIFMGVFVFVTGNPVGGIWQLLIGLFLRNAAAMSYQHVLVKNTLQGQTVARFMRPEVVTVPSYITVQELVEDYIYTLHHKLFPVIDGSRLLGCVTTRDVKATAREDWHHATVQDILSPCSADNTITANTEAIKALSRMSQHNHSRLMVVDGNQLVGIVTLKDLMEFITLKFELEVDLVSGRKTQHKARPHQQYVTSTGSTRGDHRVAARAR
jgi:CBS domain-containing protein